MHSLLRAYRSALCPQSSHHKIIVQCVCAEHIQAVHAYIKSPSIACQLIKEIHNDCEESLNVLKAVHAKGEIGSSTLDAVISIGERLSCRFLSAILQDQGVTSEFIDLSAEFEFPVSQAINQTFYDELSVLIARRVEASEVNVPVVTGFFGRVPGGLLARVGRGYTDLCASLLTTRLHAEELQVWKEVEGFYTADPRKVPNARLISKISPEEASELTFWLGNHPFRCYGTSNARQSSNKGKKRHESAWSRDACAAQRFLRRSRQYQQMYRETLRSSRGSFFNPQSPGHESTYGHDIEA